MDFIFGILGAIIISFILALLGSLGSIGQKKDETSSNFFQKFTGILMVLVTIVIVGYVLQMSGCSSEEEPNYPMKYSPD